MKIYLACGLTHVPRDEFESYVELLHKTAEHMTANFKADVKYALQDSDPQLANKPFEDRARLCYLWDKEMVEWADVIIAEASYPSTGLGIELQLACSQKTPIILVFKLEESHRASPIDYKTLDKKEHSLQLGEGYVSLMALGLPNLFKIYPYGDTEHLLAGLNSALEALKGSTDLLKCSNLN